MKEPHGRVGLVEAKTHRLDHALAPEFVHRPIGTFHGLPEALVRHFGPMGPDIHVVQEQDVNAVEAEAQKRLLEGAQGAVIE